MSEEAGWQSEGAASAPPGPVRIVIVDDHSIVRQGLRSLLEREQDLEVVGEATTAAEAIAVVGRTRPAVVLLDLKLSSGEDTEGLALCERLTGEHEDLGVLVLTTFLDEKLVVDAVHRGARGYVVKDVDTTELVRAIRAVARQESAFDSRSAAAMVQSMSNRSAAPELTERELGVLRLLATGSSNRHIGGQLYISETTVKFHVRNIMRKLGVSTRAEAVYEASKGGLI
ncbi:MadR family response regulator transcription factor [Saccharopolyspora phatthalungensis]|uniref:DNA-binding NarL/FixJ family response regulator n=1 Tax=Saccharopolyspora phatthalungensis TaxID=664693 RepID=A0A840QDJ2_9PSEU|nr:response regulator transcription factor [Saccharopolyspora phatthalungensis]MBB5158844.1 DNA-binding NarL/FixJ family response regulator [Saccharopolyspora phatthalungensis]